MLKLHQSAPFYGIANLGPPSMKLETWLRITEIPYKVADIDFSQAPKGKIPYVTTEEGQLIGDSTFIIEYLKKHYGKDPDARLGAEQRAVALAFRRMLKE